MLKWLRELLTLLSKALRATDSYDVRRYLAILFIAGGSIAMTGMVFVIIPMIAGNAGLLFWIAIAAMILIGLQQTGFIALIAKRSISISRDKITVNDEEIRDKADEIKTVAQDIKNETVNPNVLEKAQDIKDQAQDIKDSVG